MRPKALGRLPGRRESADTDPASATLPRMLTPHRDRGEILLGQSRYEQAERELRQHLAGEPDDPVGHLLLASALLGQKDPVAATAEAERAIAIDPDASSGHYIRALALIERNRHDEASESIAQALALDPLDPSLLATRSQIELERHDPKAALASLDEALALDPEHQESLLLRPVVLRRLGRLDEADAASAEGLRQQADSSAAHLMRGWVCLEQGQSKQAKAAFREALRIDPSNAAARGGLAEAIKASNPLYRLFLRYNFWMSRLGPGKTWAVLIGAYVLVQVVYRQGPKYGIPEPVAIGILVAYGLLVALTWLAYPLANLMLRLHPDGRHALTREQRIGSDLLAVPLGIAMLCLGAGVYGLAQGWETRFDWLLRAALFVLLAFPTAAIMTVPFGWPRVLLGCVCLGMLAPMLLGVAAPPLESVMQPLLILCLIGSQFLANYLAGVRVKDTPRSST